ncbi:hypothetical protein WR25_13113 [Diploscapter pachys]|uniref:Uncharacterized protein n=1 Tax=Diploscapter pachys TaxID=2018661 RepID=A0A2A2M5J6_9BILA|nr:hypothetical protein WR25_13113 [Diploscapter pachys]
MTMIGGRRPTASAPWSSDRVSSASPILPAAGGVRVLAAGAQQADAVAQRRGAREIERFRRCLHLRLQRRDRNSHAAAASAAASVAAIQPPPSTRSPA